MKTFNTEQELRAWMKERGNPIHTDYDSDVDAGSESFISVYEEDGETKFGWIVRTVDPDRMQTVPVAGKFFLVEEDAIEKKIAMNKKHEDMPEDYKCAYEVMPASLVIQETEEYEDIPPKFSEGYVVTYCEDDGEYEVRGVNEGDGGGHEYLLYINGHPHWVTEQTIDGASK